MLSRKCYLSGGHGFIVVLTGLIWSKFSYVWSILGQLFAFGSFIWPCIWWWIFIIRHMVIDSPPDCIFVVFYIWKEYCNQLMVKDTLSRSGVLPTSRWFIVYSTLLCIYIIDDLCFKSPKLLISALFFLFAKIILFTVSTYYLQTSYCQSC